MAIVYPLGIAAFWEKCRFLDYSWDIMRFEGAHQLTSGKIISTAKGKPRWGGAGTLRSETISDSLSLMAQFGMLRGSIGSFLAYDQRRPYPLLDPTGAALSGFTPQVNAIHADRDQLQVKGVPATYKLSIGDFLSIPYGSGQYYLGRLMSAATAVAGVTPYFYVEPNIPTGIVVNANINFLKPLAVMKLLPGGYKPPVNDAGRTEGIQLRFIQDLG